MSSLKKTAIFITAITLISKSIGFVREMVMAYFFGTSYIVDAYLMAVAIPGIIFGWLNSMAIAYTPIYIEVKVSCDEAKAHSFTNNIISLVFLCGMLCVIFGSIFSKNIVQLVAPNYEGEVLNLTANFLRISVFATVVTYTMNILISYLNCCNRFIQVSMSGLVFSSTQIVFIVISGLYNNMFLIYGYICSTLLYFAMIYFFSICQGWRYHFTAALTPEVRQMIAVVIPIFLSSMIGEINSFVDKMFASGLDEGSISALNYAVLVRGFIFSLFTTAVVTIIYPLLSRSIAERNITSTKNLYSKGINLTIALFIPITVGVILLSNSAVTVIYQRGVFDSHSTYMTATALCMYAIGMLPLAVNDISAKTFYSMQDTKSTLRISAISVTINIILNTILIGPLGHMGLALATSISSIVTMPMYFISLRSKIGSIGLKNTFILFAKATISSAVMGVLVMVIVRIGLHPLITVLTASLAGSIIYYILMVVMKVNEMEFFTDIIKQIFKRIMR